MADDRPDSEDRTEEPTPQRAEKAREQGQVARSRDLVSALTLSAGVGALWLGGRALFTALGTTLQVGLQNLAHPGGLRGAFGPLQAPLSSLVMAMAPFFAATVGAALTGILVQTGVPQASWLSFDVSRMSPLQRLRQLFSAGQGGWESVKVAVKAVLVAAAALRELRPLLGEMASGTLFLPPRPLALRLAELCGGLFLRLSLLMLVLGAVDYLWSRRRTGQELRMTKQEVRDEMRQSEGDPQIKRALRRRARELRKRRVAVEVPRADVVVVNPTHYAIALRYRQSDMRAPQVTAKGVDDLALHIRSLARSAGVPVVQSPRLARDLHRRVPLGREVPSDLYRAVAEVLAFVYRMRRSPVAVGGNL